MSARTNSQHSARYSASSACDQSKNKSSTNNKDNRNQQHQDDDEFDRHCSSYPQQQQQQQQSSSQRGGGSKQQPRHVPPNSLTALAMAETRYAPGTCMEHKRPAPPLERRLLPRYNIVSPNIQLPGKLRSSAPEFRLTVGVVPPLKAHARHLMGSNMIELEERMMTVRDEALTKKSGKASAKKVALLPSPCASLSLPPPPPTPLSSSSSPTPAQGILMIEEAQPKKAKSMSPQHRNSGSGALVALPPINREGALTARKTTTTATTTTTMSQKDKSLVLLGETMSSSSHSGNNNNSGFFSSPPAILPRMQQQQGAIEHKALECMRFAMLSDKAGAPVGVSMAGQTLNPMIGFDGGVGNQQQQQQQHHSKQQAASGRTRPRCVASLFSLRHSHTPGRFIIEWDGGTCRGVFSNNTTTRQAARKFLVAAARMSTDEEEEERRNGNNNNNNSSSSCGGTGGRKRRLLSTSASEPLANTFSSFRKPRAPRGPTSPPLENYYMDRFAALNDDIIFGRSEEEKEQMMQQQQQQQQQPKKGSEKKSKTDLSDFIQSHSSDKHIHSSDDDVGGDSSVKMNKNSSALDIKNNSNNDSNGGGGGKKGKKKRVVDGPEADITVMLIPADDLAESEKYYKDVKQYHEQQQQQQQQQEQRLRLQPHRLSQPYGRRESRLTDRSPNSHSVSPDLRRNSSQQQQQQQQISVSSSSHAAAVARQQKEKMRSASITVEMQNNLNSNRTSPASIGGNSDNANNNNNISNNTRLLSPPRAPFGLLSQDELDNIGAEWTIVQILYPKPGASHEASSALIGVPLHTILYAPRVALRSVKFPNRLLIAEQLEGGNGEFVLATKHLADPLFKHSALHRGEAEVSALFTFVVDSHFVDAFQRSLKKAYTDKAAATMSALMMRKRKRAGQHNEHHQYGDGRCGGGALILGSGGVGVGSDAGTGVGGRSYTNNDDDDDIGMVDRPPAEACVIQGMPSPDTFQGPGPDLAGVNFFTRNVVVTMTPCLPPSTVLWRITETFLDTDEHGNNNSNSQALLVARPQQQAQLMMLQQQHGKQSTANRAMSSSYDADLAHLLEESAELVNLNSTLGSHQSWIFYNDDSHLTMVVNAQFRGYQDSAISSAGKASLVGVRHKDQQQQQQQQQRQNQHHGGTTPAAQNNTSSSSGGGGNKSSNKNNTNNATTSQDTVMATSLSIFSSPMSNSNIKDQSQSQHHHHHHSPSPSRRRHFITEQDITVQVPPGATVRFFQGFVLGEVQFSFDAF